MSALTGLESPSPDWDALRGLLSADAFAALQLHCGAAVAAAPGSCGGGGAEDPLVRCTHR
jgi:hypothetical protein